MSVSPATAAAWVRARRVNGVTTNAAAPTRFRGSDNGCHPSFVAITQRGYRPPGRRRCRPVGRHRVDMVAASTTESGQAGVAGRGVSYL